MNGINAYSNAINPTMKSQQYDDSAYVDGNYATYPDYGNHDYSGYDGYYQSEPQPKAKSNKLPLILMGGVTLASLGFAFVKGGKVKGLQDALTKLTDENTKLTDELKKYKNKTGESAEKAKGKVRTWLGKVKNKMVEIKDDILDICKNFIRNIKNKFRR
ncbi:MAG: hypothetical protein E7Z89_04595 [Cyanobacteria bacterium SIG28]|nr:hypothetical protein [Cyanobacteria bacterium SIG28]